jgi:hypothetical protein
LIDRGRRSGKKTERCLLLMSASIDLLRQIGERLAGRIAYLEMHPIDGLEVPAEQLNSLWVRGFPDSFWRRATASVTGGGGHPHPVADQLRPFRSDERGLACASILAQNVAMNISRLNNYSFQAHALRVLR